MSNPEIELNPQPEPPGREHFLRPTNLRPIAIGLFVVGLIILVLGIARILPGGFFTGLAVVVWGLMLFAFSFIRLPQPDAAEPPMSGLQKLTGIFYEPTRVFRNLRSHPRWLAAFLVVVIVNLVYANAFVYRLTPERIVNHTFEKMEQSPIKPPPDRMEQAKEEALNQAKQPIQRIQTAAKSFFGVFFIASLVAALCLLGVLAFGGRINFWQALAAVLYGWVPVAVISKLLSLVLLFVKSPDDIHPILGQETLVQDNLGILFTPGEHPALFTLGGAIGVLSLYGLWLRAKGLANAGQKVSSSAAWGVAITIWVLGVLLLTIFATLFSSFIS